MWNRIRPETGEYGDFYQGYVEKVGDGNIFDILMDQMHETHTLIGSLTPEQATCRYAEDKWTVKEVIGHLIDSERVFAYRGLCFSRGERKDLPGFDQDEYVKEANFNDRSLQSLGEEYFSQRNSTIALFKSLPEDIMLRKGKANGFTFTVRSIPFIIAGHERHHLDVLKQKYRID